MSAFLRVIMVSKDRSDDCLNSCCSVEACNSLIRSSVWVRHSTNIRAYGAENTNDNYMYLSDWSVICISSGKRFIKVSMPDKLIAD